MFKRIFLIGIIICAFARVVFSQEHAFIYELKLGLSKDTTVRNSIITLQLKIKHKESLSSLEISMGEENSAFNVFTKSIPITSQDGNYYLVDDDKVKHFIYGSLATVQFAIPNDVASKCKYARVCGKQALSEASNVLYYKF